MAMKRPTILSVEQALSMSYATLRCAHLGWRVIRVESTPVPGRSSKGDPNRSIGRVVAGDDRHSYYVAPNVGKEAIALNLKTEEGKQLLQRLVHELPVDVFCTNTMPSRHKALGLDYQRLSRDRPDLIWCSISAMGLDFPNVPGYDPMVQALCGFMDITGNPDGPPLQCGPPIIDLKAGDEAFTQVVLALLERTETGKGRAIDVSMAQVATSWLLTFLPMLDMGSLPEELKRSGNQHRQFFPVNAYPTQDGFIYIAIGSDAQWQRFVANPMFASLDRPHLSTNEGRRANKVELNEAMGQLMSQRSTQENSEVLAKTAIPHSPITPIEGVVDLPFMPKNLLRTTAPNGREIRLPPPAVQTSYLESQNREMPFCPGYGEQTDAILEEVGFGESEVERLREDGVVA